MLGFKKLFKEIQHTEIIREIEKYTILDASFIVLTILAGIIATLGLIMNNVTIIIGAMIIAPLMWPILHVATGILRGSTSVLSQGIISLIISTLLTVCIAVIVSLLTPIPNMTEEILLRTQPNILDLIVALSSGAVAALALNWPKLSNSIAGVAVAVALVPPLGVIGIGLAKGDMSIASGASLLYLTNLLAILFISVVIFRLMGFYPRRFIKNEDEATMRSGVMLSSILIILIAIPLAGFFMDSLTNSRQDNNLSLVFNAHVKEIDKDIRVSKFSVKRSDQSATKISVIVHAPPYTFITKEQKDALSKTLAFIEEKTVDIDIEIIPVLKAGVEVKPEQIERIKEEKQSSDLDSELKLSEEGDEEGVKDIIEDSKVLEELEVKNGSTDENTQKDNLEE